MAKARQRAARERQERLEQALKEFEQLEKEDKDKEQRRVSTSDPEARVMKQPGGGYAPSYNVQIDTDAKNGVVVAVGVVQAGNDFEQLERGVDRVEDNLKETPKEVVTDGGYVSKDTIVAMKERAIEYIAPCVDEAGKGQSSYDNRGVSAEYQSSQFIYDAQSNSYLCPQGKTLSYEGKEQRHLQVSYRYRAKRSDCQGCPMKSQCCPGQSSDGAIGTPQRRVGDVAEFRHEMRAKERRDLQNRAKWRRANRDQGKLGKPVTCAVSRGLSLCVLTKRIGSLAENAGEPVERKRR